MGEGFMGADGAVSRALLVVALAVVAGGLCWIAGRAGLMPNEVSARSNHARATSRAGGAVIVLVFAVAVLALGRLDALGPPVFGQGDLNLFVGIVCAGLLGLIDDAVGLGAGLKLAALTVVAAIVAGAAGPVETLPVPLLGTLALPGGVGFVLAALWVLGFVNVFNFLDGLNGMAAGTGGVLLAGLAVMGAPPLLCLCLAATLFGFAVPNVMGGRPFLGDAGSLAVGTAIAGAALVPGGAMVWLLAGAAMPLLADAGLTMLRRASEGEAVMEAHSEHAYQRLHRAGWSHQAVALAYTLIAGCGVVAAIFAARLGQDAWAPWAVIFGGLVLWLIVTRVMMRVKGGDDLDA